MKPKIELEIGKTYQIELKMIKAEEFSISDYTLEKYFPDAACEVFTGHRNVKVCLQYNTHHIVETWLSDPHGERITSIRLKLMATKYLERLVLPK